MKTIYDNWTKQSIGWPSDSAGGVCAVRWLTDHKIQLRSPEALGIAAALCERHDIPKDVRFRCGRSFIHVFSDKEYPVNVLVYANDILKLGPEDFRTAHLDYMFTLEEAKK